MDETYVGNVILLYVLQLLDTFMEFADGLLNKGVYSSTPCQVSLSTDSFAHNFCPVTRFEEVELHQALLDVKTAIASLGPIEDIKAPIPEFEHWISTREILKCDYNFSEECFGRLLAHGVPIKIGEVGNHLQVSWTPKFFKDVYGHLQCQVENTSTGDVRSTSVGEFFNSFGEYTESRPVEKLKVSC